MRHSAPAAAGIFLLSQGWIGSDQTGLGDAPPSIAVSGRGRRQQYVSDNADMRLKKESKSRTPCIMGCLRDFRRYR